MEWFLWCLGIFAFFIPIVTSLLEANNENFKSRPPYPQKMMRIIFFIGIIILIIALYLTVK